MKQLTKQKSWLKTALPRPKVLTSLMTAISLTFLVAAGPDALAADAGITVTSDRLVYRPGDDINISILINSGGQPLNGDLVLQSYPPKSPTATDIFAGEPLAEKVIEADLSLSGEKAIEYGTDTAALELGLGGYPVRVILRGDEREQLAGDTWISVVELGDRAPLDLVLLWTAGAPPERNAKGEFESLGILEQCRNEPRSPLSLLQHREIAQKYPGIKTVYGIEPALLEQLQDISDGFELRQGDQVTEYPDTSPEAAAATSCLESLAGLAATANTEILSFPYAYARLPLMAKEGWSDGSGQYRTGDDVLSKALMLPEEPEGAYAPGLDVTTDSLRYIAATGGDYSVLAGATRNDIEGNMREGAVSFRLRDVSGERITSFFADDGASAALTGAEPDAAALVAVLANAYTSPAGAPLVIAASSEPNPSLAADQRDRLYAALDAEDWIQSITLAEARDKYHPDTEPVTLLRYLDPTSGYLSQSYFQRLSQVHGLYEDFRAAVDTHEPVLQTLSRMLFTAESEYWAGEDARPEDANKGIAYLEEIARITDEEFRSLEIDVATPWLQRSMTGTSTITIRNGASHPFTLQLALTGEGVELTGNLEETIRVEPGTTSIEVPFRSEGWNSLKASISSGETAIAEDSAVIHPVSARVWIVILVAAAALLAGIVYYILVIRPAGEH